MTKEKSINLGDVYDLLFMASRIGNLEIVKKIFEQYKNIDVNIADEFDNSPLHEATKYNNVDVVEYLIINEGAEVNAKNKDGRTALHVAIEENNFEIASLLILHGAICVKDNEGRTPIHLAVLNKRYNILNLFILAEYDIDIKDNKGMTPLDLAKNDERMISILHGNIFQIANEQS